MIVLGIETSCDETAVAVVADDPCPVIRANLIHTQLEEHAPYGGVVPEIAARAHLDHIDGLVRRALAEADTSVDRLDGVAAAAGPGLIGGLIVGSMAAKGSPGRRRSRTSRSITSRRMPSPRGSRTMSGFRICCCWFPAVIPSFWFAPGSAAIASSAPAATMPPARPSTRPPSFWVSATPADRR